MIELRRNDAWAFVFFTLRDPSSGACLSATIPRRRFDALELALADGEKVLVEGKAELYAAKGALSFRATTIERVGLGDHLAAIERLKRLLAAEGLFAAERKRPLPRFPRAVGVVTGADAAARGDVVTGIQSRYPSTHIVITETRVQGAGAPEAIAAAAEARRSASVRRRRDRRPRRRQLRRSPAVQLRGRRAGTRCLSRPRRVGGGSRAGHAALRPRRRRACVDADRSRPPRRAGSRRAARRRWDASGPGSTQPSGALSTGRGTGCATPATGSRAHLRFSSSVGGSHWITPPRGSRRSRPARHSRVATRSSAPAALPYGTRRLPRAESASTSSSHSGA